MWSKCTLVVKQFKSMYNIHHQHLPSGSPGFFALRIWALRRVGQWTVIGTAIIHTHIDEIDDRICFLVTITFFRLLPSGHFAEHVEG